MEHKASFKNKARRNVVATHSDKKSNILRGISFAITFCTELIPLTHELNGAELRKNKSLVLYVWLETAR